MVRHDNFELATRRARELGAVVPRVVSATYNRSARRVVVQLSSNLMISFSPTDVEGLEDAKPSQLAEIEISPSGFGLHFPAIDADLYVPALLEGFGLNPPGSTRGIPVRAPEIPGQILGQFETRGGG